MPLGKESMRTFVLLVAGYFSWVLMASPVLAQQNRPPATAPVIQPIPFSHKQHVAIGLECVSCHTMPDEGDEAGLPATKQCMICHQEIKTDSTAIKLLSKYNNEEKPVPWVRIYNLPGFVFFNHKEHVGANVKCEECHGPVGMEDVLAKDKDLTMNFCVDCHRARKALITCTTCHQLPK